jgi:NitT/TauT family transport system permease protein
VRRILRGLLIPVLAAVLWEAGSRAGVLPMDTLSRPSDIALAAAGGFADGTILVATWQTVEAALSGFAIAAVLGILIGAALGLSPALERVVGPSIDALRPVPSVALMPLTLLLFGFGLEMEAWVVAFACIWPVLLVTAAAVRGVEPRLHEVARVLELSFASRLRRIVLPAALTVEIVINPRGLGYGMIIAQQSLHPDLMYAQLLWLGLLGWGMNVALTRSVGRWHGFLGPDAEV